MIFCLVWGVGGSFLSLALSRVMAKMMMRIRVISPHTQSPVESRLLQRVHYLAQRAGLSTPPEVGIFESPVVNAFATGPTRNRALVAVSTGLLNQMDDDAIEGVLAHEVSHVANGDMVTMALLQGVANAFVMFLARVLAFFVQAALDRGENRDRNNSYGRTNFMLVWLFEIVLMLLAGMVLSYYSRHREYRADRGGAILAGRAKMIGALNSLLLSPERYQAPGTQIPKSLAAFQINSITRRFGNDLIRLFSTHPTLEDRIERLKAATDLI
jgi:heat shock protein HtpX